MNLTGKRINNPSEPRMGEQARGSVAVEIREPVWRHIWLVHPHAHIDGLIEVLRDESRQ